MTRFSSEKKEIQLEGGNKSFSNSYFHEKNIFKYFTGTLVGYLLIRELPIRNFYARSTIMFFYFLSLRDVFQFRGLTKPINTGIVLQDNENISRQFQAYQNIREATNEIEVEKKGITDEKLWRWAQPGFIQMKQPLDGVSSKLFAPWHKKKIEWDGTFNQPILPLADRHHRDVANLW